MLQALKFWEPCIRDGIPTKRDHKINGLSLLFRTFIMTGISGGVVYRPLRKLDHRISAQLFGCLPNAYLLLEAWRASRALAQRAVDEYYNNQNNECIQYFIRKPSAIKRLLSDERWKDLANQNLLINGFVSKKSRILCEFESFKFFVDRQIELNIPFPSSYFVALMKKGLDFRFPLYLLEKKAVTVNVNFNEQNLLDCLKRVEDQQLFDQLLASLSLKIDDKKNRIQAAFEQLLTEQNGHNDGQRLQAAILLLNNGASIQHIARDSVGDPFLLPIYDHCKRYNDNTWKIKDQKPNWWQFAQPPVDIRLPKNFALNPKCLIARVAALASTLLAASLGFLACIIQNRRSFARQFAITSSLSLLYSFCFAIFQKDKAIDRLNHLAISSFSGHLFPAAKVAEHIAKDINLLKKFNDRYLAKLDDCGKSLFDYICPSFKNSTKKKLDESSLERANILVAKIFGSFPELKNEYLIKAAATNQIEIFKIVKNYVSDISETTQHHCFLQARCPEFAKHLAKIFNIESKNSDNKTPLLVALENKIFNRDLVCALVDAGANTNFKTANGLQAWQYLRSISINTLQ